MTGTSAAGSAHTHALSGATAAGAAHTHALSGASASSLSSTQSVLNPYMALFYIKKVA